MPLSYDDLEEGRRRKWEKLKDPEAREAEEKARKEADPEAKKKMSAYQARLRNREEEHAAEQEKWRKTKRDVAIIAAAFVAFVITILGVQWAISSAISASRRDRFQELNAAAIGGEPYASFNGPAETWASWRNAWERRDAEAIFGTYSPAMAERERGNMTEGAYVTYLERMLRSGGRDYVREIAREFRRPVIVHYPSGDPDEGDLAVLKTRPVAVRGMASNKERVWVLAMAWVPERRQWLVHELRDSIQWNEDWTKASQIAPLRRRDE